MSDNKTRPTGKDVIAFLESVEHEKRRSDAFDVMRLMQEVVGEEPRMWGPSIVGFGEYHYVYESGREGDMPLVGFSPRKRNLTLYIMDGFDGYEALLARLGKHRTGKSCLYINKLDDVDLDVLRTLIRLSAAHVAATHPQTGASG